MPAARVIEASFYDAHALDELKRKYSNLRLVNATLVFGFATLFLSRKVLTRHSKNYRLSSLLDSLGF